jgi:DNA-damage-inducible protein J
MAKTSNLYARIEPEVKEQAEAILSTLGISASNAVTMFYKQIIFQRGLPFEVKIPNPKVVDMTALTKDELNTELEKGYSDIIHGRTKSAKSAFSNIRKDYNI